MRAQSAQNRRRQIQSSENIKNKLNRNRSTKNKSAQSMRLETITNRMVFFRLQRSVTGVTPALPNRENNALKGDGSLHNFFVPYDYPASRSVFDNDVYIPRPSIFLKNDGCFITKPLIYQSISGHRSASGASGELLGVHGMFSLEFQYQPLECR